MKNLFLAFIDTLYHWLTRQGYPTVRTWGSWSWTMTSKGVKYHHWKSFFQHVKSR